MRNASCLEGPAHEVRNGSGRRTPTFAHVSICFLLFAFLGACNASRMPAASPSSVTAPSSVALNGFTVSGVAYEHTDAAIHPLAGLPLRVSGYRDKLTPVTVDVVTDSAGGYEVAGMEREFVQVTVRPQDTYLSPCSLRLWLWNDDPKNVHVVSKASLLATGIPGSLPPLSKVDGYGGTAVVSGYVMERTREGLRPVPEASVEHLYGDGTSGDPTGFTVTNAAGYYVLCGYDDDYGQAVRVHKNGYGTSIRSIGPSWKVDFELTHQ